MKVLIITNNPFDQAAIIRLVSRNPACLVDTADCIISAKIKIDDNIDFIILDLILPKTSGERDLDRKAGLYILRFIKECFQSKKRLPDVVVMSQLSRDKYKHDYNISNKLLGIVTLWNSKIEGRQRISSLISNRTFKNEKK